jgi:hypothetical protein
MRSAEAIGKHWWSGLRGLFAVAPDVSAGSVAKNEISYFCALEVVDFSILDLQI